MHKLFNLIVNCSSMLIIVMGLFDTGSVSQYQYMLLNKEHLVLFKENFAFVVFLEKIM